MAGDAKRTLTRHLGRLDALAIGVGSVIGTGIFRTTGEVLRGAGGFLGASFVWIVVAVISAAGALVYADLAARVPEAGGPYAYVREAFGRRAAFLDGSVSSLVSVPAEHAAAIGVVGEVLAQLFGVPHARALGLVALAALVALNLPGVRGGTNAQRFFTTWKLALVVGVVVLGATAFVHGGPEAAPPPLPSVPFATAVAACWYSFTGWQDTALLTEEMRDPARDMRFVLLATVGIVAAAYLAVHVALYVGLGAAGASASLPTLALARRFFGAAGEKAMSVALLVSMLGGAAESILVRPRVLFALARDGLAPRALTYVNRGGTPAGAMVLHAAIVFFLLATGSFRSLLALVAFTQSLTGLAEAGSALVLLKGTSRGASGPVAKGLLVLASGALCVLVARDDPRQIAYAAGILLVLLAYFHFRPEAPSPERKLSHRNRS